MYPVFSTLFGIVNNDIVSGLGISNMPPESHGFPQTEMGVSGVSSNNMPPESHGFPQSISDGSVWS
jgi:hypothetical protein